MQRRRALPASLLLKALALPRSNPHSHRRLKEGEGTASVGCRRDIALAPTKATGRDGIRPGGTQCLQSDLDCSGRQEGSGEPGGGVAIKQYISFSNDFILLLILLLYDFTVVLPSSSTLLLSMQSVLQEAYLCRVLFT